MGHVEPRSISRTADMLCGQHHGGAHKMLRAKATPDDALFRSQPVH
jgi:hypothetical protein